ncbi:MAG: hypothetical protein FWH18_03090 [Marinilabiliaceae bacterium]|nr:hypothetical protein [Marinilabiliaceae bacterium]
MNRIKIFCVISAFLFLQKIDAQEDGLHHVIRINGRIVNQQSGKELQSNEQVNMHTMLLFGKASDNAILRSPSQRKYELVSPGTLLVSSEKSLREMKSRPMTDTNIRLTGEMPPETLRKYFGADTFAIVGNRLDIEVGPQNQQKYDLLFRFKENKKNKEVVSNDFAIKQSDFGTPFINECTILLREGNNVTEVTKVSIVFVDEQNLRSEFTAWLTGMEEITDTNYKKREELQQYCRDVYGVMDHDNMHYAIGRYLEDLK